MTDFTGLLGGNVKSMFDRDGSARIVSEQHDTSKISLGEFNLDDEIRKGRIQPWDAYEYGITREEAQQRMDEATTPEEKEKVLVELKQRAVRRFGLDDSTGRIALMSANNVVPWHGLGTVIDSTATTREALELAALARWEIQQIKLGYEHNGKWHETNESAVIRGDTGAWFANLNNGYQVFANEDLAELVDAVCESQGGVVETAGAIGNGHTVWMLANVSECDDCVVPGDELKSYIMFSTTHNGSGAVKVYPTDIRTVCQNTYTQACLDESNVFYSIRHTRHMKSRIVDTIAKVQRSKADLRQFGKTAKELATTQLPKPQEYFQRVLDRCQSHEVGDSGQYANAENIEDKSIFRALMELDPRDRGKAEKSLDRHIKRRGTLFGDICQRYDTDRCNGMTAISGTAWAAWNAVTEHADHSPLRRFKGEVKVRAESRMKSVMEGSSAEMKSIAFQELAQSV